MNKILILSVFILAAGCGKPANVAVVPLKDEGLRVFPKNECVDKPLVLNQVTMFLWKENFTSDDVRTAIRTGERLEKLEVDNKTNEKRYKILEKLVGTLVEDQRTALANIQEVQGKIDEILIKIDEIKNSDLTDDQKTKKIERLNKKKTQLEDEIATYQEDLREIKPEINRLQSEISEKENLARTIDQQKPELDSFVTRMAATVDLFNPPPSEFRIQFDPLVDGVTHVSISSWDTKTGLGVQSFSTEKGTIVLVSYDEKGGILKFHVLGTGPAEYYKFELVRVGYEKAPAEGVFFSGSIERVRPGEATRYGVVKLSQVSE